MIRMLIVGYVFAIRSERALCREVQVNLAYRWFCGLGIEDKHPRSFGVLTRPQRALPRQRYLPPRVRACRRGLHRGRPRRRRRLCGRCEPDRRPTPTSIARSRARSGARSIDPERRSRAVKEYLATLDDPAYGAASDVTPKFVSPSDPAAQWTGALRNAAFFAYADNYLIDVKFGDHHGCRGFARHPAGRGRRVADDDRANRGLLWHQARMARGRHRLWLGLQPRLAGQRARDRAACSGHRQVEARRRHIQSREDFTFDKERNVYICPAGKTLTTTGRLVNDGGDDAALFRERATTVAAARSKRDAAQRRRIAGSRAASNEEARDVARALAKTEAFAQSRRDRKKVEMLFAHLKRILRLGRLRLRGPSGAQVRVHAGSHRTEPEAACQACGSRPAGHVHRVRCVNVVFSL